MSPVGLLSGAAPCRMILHLLYLSAAGLLLAGSVSARQSETNPLDEPLEPRYGYGAQILLSNSGFGIGGYYQRTLALDYTLVWEGSLSAGKDEREVAFFDRFGRKDVPNKANYLLLLPIQVGVEKRLFRSSIEDNFRPFFRITTGPTIGWRSPYFNDQNENGLLDDDEPTFDVIDAFPYGSFEFGLGATFAFGAHLGSLSGATQSVRIGYSFTYFKNEIELLSRTIREPTRFFGSPVILVSFGKLR